MNAADILKDPKLRKRVLRTLQDEFHKFAGSEVSDRIFKRSQDSIYLLVLAEAQGDDAAANTLRQTLALDADLVKLRASKAAKSAATQILFSLVRAFAGGLSITLKGTP
jgi:hypothetical protein